MAAESVSQEKKDGDFEFYIYNYCQNHNHHNAADSESQGQVRRSWSCRERVGRIDLPDCNDQTCN